MSEGQAKRFYVELPGAHVEAVEAREVLVDNGVLAFYDEGKRLILAYGTGSWVSVVPEWPDE